MPRTSQAQYRQRRPEETVLYRLVQAHFESFLLHVRDECDKRLPKYVENEFRRYLECGQLAHGFARALCSGCGHELLVPFSCKLRGICPSCNARRMGGHAFVTEFADEFNSSRFAALRRMTRTLDDLRGLWDASTSLGNEDLVLRLVMRYPGSGSARPLLSQDQTRSLLQRFASEDIELDLLLAEPACFHSLGCVDSGDAAVCDDASCDDWNPTDLQCEEPNGCVPGAFDDLDREGLLEAIESEWIQPLEDATALFEQHSYLTRLYTTRSPSEMTVDPVFGLNPDLPRMLSNTGVTLDYEGGCETDTAHPWTWGLGQGAPLRGFGTTWPWTVDNFESTTAPLVWRAEQHSTSGRAKSYSGSARSSLNG